MRVEKGKRLKPLALMVHAPHGIGKTNLPIEAHKPIYVGSEENDEIDAERLPKVEEWEVLNPKSPNAEAGLVNQMKWLLNNDHGYKTLVIDTLDALEQIAQKTILAGTGKTMQTAFGGYGKAYAKMHDMFLSLRDDYLVPLRDKKGMNIVILCHSDKVKHEDPMTNTSYDHYATALHKSIKPVFEDWVSAIFFINYQLFKAEASDGREHAVGTGSRMIYTEERPSHVAKNRFNLPFQIPYSKSGTWAVIGGHIKAYFGSATKFVAPDREQTNVDPVIEKIPAPLPEGMTMEMMNKSLASDAPNPAPSVNHDFVQIGKAIDEIFHKLDESVKPKITLAIQRAGSDVKELTRIYDKMQTMMR